MRDGILAFGRNDEIDGFFTEGRLKHGNLRQEPRAHGKNIHLVHLKDWKVVTVPFGALVPKKTENLLVVGRCFSCDRLVELEG